MACVQTVFSATGSYIPPLRVPNSAFLDRDFRNVDGSPISKPNAEIVDQFEAITGIRERRYAPEGVDASDMAFQAARDALDSSGIDGETLDGIIVAHNFCDVRGGRSDLVPALAARVKAKLKIRNPGAVAFDLVFGCPGWLQGVIQADAMIKAGHAKRVMIIGADTLSRISDPHDRDSMIYADGAGATIVEAREGDERVGILAHAPRSDTLNHSGMLFMGPSYKNEVFLEALFLKMEGRKLYRYALETVAAAMKQCLDKAGIAVDKLKKILLHQANGKMDEAITNAFYESYGIIEPPAGIMSMTIS